MDVGIMIEGQEGLTWERWFRLAEAAEDLGYESLCRSDHLTGLAGQSARPALDTWTSITALATRTRRIRFGPMVSPLTFYQPAILAKMAHAVDLLSGGRLDLGIGAGWNEYEHRMFGVPFPGLKERLDRLECGARLIRALDEGRPVSLAQPYWPLDKAEAYPRPTRGRLRLVIGGRGEKRTLPIIAAFADEWNVTRVDPEGFETRRRILAARARALGREPEGIRRSLMVPCAVGRDRSEVVRRIAAMRASFPALPEDETGWRAASFLAGSPDDVAAYLAAWAKAGLQRVLLQTLDQEDIAGLTLFARDVMPQVAKL
jgi:alkanesulfonate monooxygenase SsuD/methylene tetrahydromethanopterin reductase-like flavin-dependent oxidoreductase (luciferase family)